MYINILSLLKWDDIYVSYLKSWNNNSLVVCLDKMLKKNIIYFYR